MEGRAEVKARGGGGEGEVEGEEGGGFKKTGRADPRLVSSTSILYVRIVARWPTLTHRPCVDDRRPLPFHGAELLSRLTPNMGTGSARKRGMTPRRYLASAVALGLVVGCSSSTATTPIATTPIADAAPDAPIIDRAACSTTCGSGSYCAYPHRSAICGVRRDGGGAMGCDPGCPGCPPLPPPSCEAMPVNCADQPSCECLVAQVCGCTGSVNAGQCGFRDGQWIVDCISC